MAVAIIGSLFISLDARIRGGDYRLGEYLYIFDEAITKINLIQDLDDGDYKSIRNLIDEAINTDKEEGSDKS